MSFPAPTASQIESAFKAHGVRYKVEPLKAGSPGRAWSSGLRAIVDHHTAGSNSLALLQNSGGNYPSVQVLISKDGIVHVLTWLSCWGSGDGGPWSGVADKNSLHLVGWQNEVESLGGTKDFTTEQMESLGRVNAALVSLGVPAENEINHEDWTDGTNGVGGYPLPTNGRKIDTLYETPDLRANTAKYKAAPPTTPSPEEDDMLVKRTDNGWQYLLQGGKFIGLNSAAYNSLKSDGMPSMDADPQQYDRLIKAYGEPIT